MTTRPISVGRKFPADLLHVLPLLNCGQNRSVGGRAADAAFFEFFHQRRFVVTRRRLGEVLLRLQFLERELLSGFERGQLVLQFLVLFVFAFLRLLVNSQEAVELDDRSGHAEPENFIAVLGVDVHRGLIEDRRIDLRSDEALPDQLVNLELIFFQILLELVGMAHRRRRTDRFVRSLRILLFFKSVRGFGQVLSDRIPCQRTRALLKASGATRVESVRM